MCTVTWFFTEEGYELFVNRDELRSRGVAEEPRQGRAGNVRYLAPRDPDAGGTWLLVNEHAVAVGVLNAQVAEATTDGPALSRGRLVLDLAELATPSDLEERLERERLSRRMPFTLFALAPGGRAVVLDYDGRQVSRRNAGDPALLSSSSLVPGGAAEPRQRDLEDRLALLSDPRRARLEFHRSHRPERGPLSACMHRPDARTVSFSHVRVAAESVHFTYVDGPPCSTQERVTRELPRSAWRATEATPAGGE